MDIQLQKVIFSYKKLFFKKKKLQEVIETAMNL